MGTLRYCSFSSGVWVIALLEHVALVLFTIVNVSSTAVSSGVCACVFCLQQKLPPRPSFTRALSFLSGYVIRAQGEGCRFFYVSHNDPKGEYWACKH